MKSYETEDLLYVHYIQKIILILKTDSNFWSATIADKF